MIRSGHARRVRGFNLAEVAIVLAIAGLVAAAVWVAAGRISRGVAVTTAGNQLFEIVNNVRALYSSQQGIYGPAAPGNLGGACAYNSLTGKLSCQNLFPRDMVAGALGAVPRHQVGGAGGAVTVEPMSRALVDTTTAAPGEANFGVIFADLPLDACIALATRFSSPDQKMKLRAVLFADATNAFTAQGWATVGVKGPLPISPQTAVTECRNAAVAAGTTLEWVFSLR